MDITSKSSQRTEHICNHDDTLSHSCLPCWGQHWGLDHNHNPANEAEPQWRRLRALSPLGTATALGWHEAHLQTCLPGFYSLAREKWNNSPVSLCYLMARVMYRRLCLWPSRHQLITALWPCCPAAVTTALVFHRLTHVPWAVVCHH
jgi:hypothetical protein